MQGIRERDEKEARRNRVGEEGEGVAGVRPMTPRQLQLVGERGGLELPPICSHLNTAA